jgi:hypothetical protein
MIPKVEALAQQHPTLAAESGCGWGLEPLAKGMRQGNTLLHMEGQPGLDDFCAKMGQRGIRLSGAFALATLVLQTQTKPITRTLVVARGFMLITVTPSSSSGAAIGRTRVSPVLWNPATQTNISPPETAQHRLEEAGFFTEPVGIWRIIGEPDDLRALGVFIAAGDNTAEETWARRLVQFSNSITTWPELIMQARKQSRAWRVADLMESFPRPRPIGAALTGAGVLCGLIGLGFIGATLLYQQGIERRIDSAKASIRDAEAQSNSAAVMERTITTLEGRVRDLGADAPPRFRGEMLRVLGDALPENFVLVSFSAQSSGAVSAVILQLVDDGGAALESLEARFAALGYRQTRIEPIKAERIEGVTVTGPQDVVAYKLTATYSSAATQGIL